MPPGAELPRLDVPPLVYQPFGVETFLERQRYPDLAVLRKELPPVHASQARPRLLHMQFGASNDCLAVLEMEEGQGGEGRLHGALQVLNSDGNITTPSLPVELAFTPPTTEELTILKEHKQALIWAIQDMQEGRKSNDPGVAAMPQSYQEVYHMLGGYLHHFDPAQLRIIRSLPVLDKNGKVLLGHYSSRHAMFLHESQVDILDTFLHQLLELWLPSHFPAHHFTNGQIHIQVPALSVEALGPPTPGTSQDDGGLRASSGQDWVTVSVGALIRGSSRPRPEATAPEHSDSQALAQLGDPTGKGIMAYLVLRRFSLSGVRFAPKEGFQVLTPQTLPESLDPRGVVAFEPHPDDVALFAGAYVSCAKGRVPTHMISAVPDPAGVTDQYMADILTLAALACGPGAATAGSPRLVHARLVAQTVFPASGETARTVREAFGAAEACQVAARFASTFPVLSSEEVARVRGQFSAQEWRCHKRSLRVYEGYLGFLYMGDDTAPEGAYTNLIWDLPLSKGAFAPKGTLLSYWSKFQPPSERDCQRLRKTLRGLKGAGVVILPAPHHRHPQHRQLTRVTLPIVLEELPGASVMLYEDLTGFTHLRPNVVNAFDGATGMWMARTWEAFGSQEARNPYRAMWYDFVRKGAVKERKALEAEVENENWRELCERFLVGTLHWESGVQLEAA